MQPPPKSGETRKMINKNHVNTLTQRYIQDLLKKDFDIFERAEIIREYLNNTGKSQAQFCKENNIPETTLHTWLLFGTRITKEEYEKQIQEGTSKTTLFKNLRGDKTPSTQLEKYLEEVITKIRGYKITVKETTPRTQTIIQTTINELNNLSIELQSKEKKKKI